VSLSGSGDWATADAETLAPFGSRRGIDRCRDCNRCFGMAGLGPRLQPDATDKDRGRQGQDSAQLLCSGARVASSLGTDQAKHAQPHVTTCKTTCTLSRVKEQAQNWLSPHHVITLPYGRSGHPGPKPAAGCSSSEVIACVAAWVYAPPSYRVGASCVRWLHLACRKAGGRAHATAPAASERSLNEE